MSKKKKRSGPLHKGERYAWGISYRVFGIKLGSTTVYSPKQRQAYINRIWKQWGSFAKFDTFQMIVKK